MEIEHYESVAKSSGSAFCSPEPRRAILALFPLYEGIVTNSLSLRGDEKI